MTFIFKTTTTMKEYNARKWWIDSGIVREIQITADNLPAALEQYREIVEEKHYISISAHAIKNRNPMYIDTPDGEKQIGFVITGKTDFESNYKWITQYINLWVTVLTVIDTIFE